MNFENFIKLNHFRILFPSLLAVEPTQMLYHLEICISHSISSLHSPSNRPPPAPTSLPLSPSKSTLPHRRSLSITISHQMPTTNICSSIAGDTAISQVMMSSPLSYLPYPQMISSSLVLDSLCFSSTPLKVLLPLLFHSSDTISDLQQLLFSWLHHTYWVYDR